MWLLTACKISVSLSLSIGIKNEMIFLSYLWNNFANIYSEIRRKKKKKKKKSFHFWSTSKTRDLLKFYRLSDATFYDPINNIYQFIKPFLDKTLFFRNMDPLRGIGTLS